MDLSYFQTEVTIVTDGTEEPVLIDKVFNDWKTKDNVDSQVSRGLSLVKIRKTVALVIESEQWNWYYRYKDWEREEPEYTEGSTQYGTFDNEGTFIFDENLLQAAKDEWETRVPTRPPLITPDQWLENYGIPRKLKKAERAKAVDSLKVTVEELTFDANEDSQNRMAREVASADSMEETVKWTLADNSVQEITIGVLKKALREAAVKQSELWNIT